MTANSDCWFKVDCFWLAWRNDYMICMVGLILTFELYWKPTFSVLVSVLKSADHIEGEGSWQRKWVCSWKAFVSINCSPATCILTSPEPFKAPGRTGFIGGLEAQLLLSGVHVWDVWTDMVGHGLLCTALVYSAVCARVPLHWSIDTRTAAEGSCCTTRTQNRP